MLQASSEHKNEDRQDADMGLSPREKRRAAIKDALKYQDSLGSKEALIGTDLVASVFVGALLGWFVGRLFGIKSPLPLIVGIFLGAIAGFREVYRVIARGIEEERRSKDAQGGRESTEEQPTPERE